MTEIEMYVLLKLDAVRETIGVFGFLSVLLVVASVICRVASDLGELPHPPWQLRLSLTIPVALATLGLWTLCPTTKEAAMILVAPRITEAAPHISDEMTELYGLAKDWLRAQADEED